MKVILKITPLLHLSSFATHGVFKPSPEEIKEQQIKLGEWIEVAENSPEMNRDEAFEKLGIGIPKTLKRSIYSIDQTGHKSALIWEGSADPFVRKRLMCSGFKMDRKNPGICLIKKEWDLIEAWLKSEEIRLLGNQ